MKLLSRLKAALLRLSPLMILVVTVHGSDTPIGAQPSWISPELRVDWSRAGLEYEPANVTQEVNFLDYGGSGNGTRDNAPALQALIDALDSDTVVYFPDGDYLFNSRISLSARPGEHTVIFRGAGWDRTRLIFDIPESGWTGLIDISGERVADPVPVTSSLKKGSLSIEVADASGIHPGDNLILSQENNHEAMGTAHREGGMPQLQHESLETWAERSVGQFLQVTGRSGNVLTLKHPLNLTFDWGGATIQKINTCQNVGMENFSLVNRSNVNGLSSILITWADNCWVKGVHSYNTVRMHVAISSSRNILVSGNFFDDAFRHGGGGHGYGVVCASFANDCLVTNNIFRHLRHSMMIKEGASANVFSYNYSFDGIQDEAPVAKDISVHGHYPFMNLFEGNVVEFIHCSDWWGSAGPGNTFYRNHVARVGIKLQDLSPGQIVVANEVPTDPEGLAVLTRGGEFRMKNHIAIHSSVSDDPLIFANITTDHPASNDQQDLPPSLYLNERPEYWPREFPWPAFGPPSGFGINKIPAQLRWKTIVESLAR